MAQAVYSLGCWLYGLCSVPGRGKNVCVFGLACGVVLGSDLWVMEAVSLGLKRPGREVDLLFLASAEVNAKAPCS
jgi:hypothetical protein